MTTILNRKKRALESDQSRYENSISSDDTDTFMDLIKQGQVTVASVQAMQNASASKKNFYLREIMSRMNPDDFRKIVFPAASPVEKKESPITTTVSETTTTTSAPAKKAKTAAKNAKNELVEEIVAEWPFQLARVVWNENFTTKKDEKPMTVAESKEKWHRLFAIAEKFCNNSGVQNEVFNRIDELTLAEKVSTNSKFEEKLQNCRQSVRLCLNRLFWVTKMIFTISPRTPEQGAQPTTCDFNQLFQKYSIAIPKASNFKGRGPYFCSFFMQHLNSVVFDGSDVVLTKIEYENDEVDENNDEQQE